MAQEDETQMQEEEAESAPVIPAAVLGRIEEFILSWLCVLADGESPAPSFELQRQHGPVTRKLTAQGGRSYCQVLFLLVFVQMLLQQGRVATARELWYSVKTRSSLFRNQQDVDQAVLDVAALLGVQRHRLNLVASAKGLLAGPVRFRLSTAGGPRAQQQPWTDCGVGPTLVGSTWIQDELQVEGQCRYILVVEKESVFKRLWEARITESLGGIVLITAKGYPDIATRACLQSISGALGVPVFGLADLNPHGVSLLLTYRLGSARSGYSYTAPLHWLGLRSSQAQKLDLPEYIWQDFTSNDRSKCRSLLRGAFFRSHEAWAAELEAMEEAGCKCELEALASLGPTQLPAFVVKAILQRDFV